MKKCWKRWTFAYSLLALVCITVISATGAYFSDSAVVGGTLGMGVLNIKLCKSDGTTETTTTTLSKDKLTPGDEILQGMKIVNDGTNIPVYLRITMLIPSSVASVLTFANTATMPGTGWNMINSSGSASTTADSVTISSTGYNRYQWYYASGTTLTEYEFGSDLSIFATTSNLKVSGSVTSSTAISNASIRIFVDAVQADNIDATPAGFNGVVALRTGLSL